jgi:hypothetical protein
LSLEHQGRAERYVVRGVESGEATADEVKKQIDGCSFARAIGANRRRRLEAWDASPCPLVSISHPLAVSTMHSREFLLKSGIDSVS